MFKEIFDYREMIYSLVRKDLKSKYKGSVLGFMWTFINPLLQLIVYTLVFKIIMRANVEKFYLYLFVALIPWLFFSVSITGGASSILAQKDLVKKIYFPREIIPISYVAGNFVNMLLSFIVVFIVSIVSGIKISPLGILCLPVIMIIEFFFALGIAMITSAVTVYFRDLEHILGIITMMWMYGTPICYPMSMVPEKYLGLYRLNPMTPIVEAYRAIFYYGTIPDLKSTLGALIFAVVFMVLGFFVFGRLKRHFAEEL